MLTLPCQRQLPSFSFFSSLLLSLSLSLPPSYVSDFAFPSSLRASVRRSILRRWDLHGDSSRLCSARTGSSKFATLLSPAQRFSSLFILLLSPSLYRVFLFTVDLIHVSTSASSNSWRNSCFLFLLTLQEYAILL